MTTCSLAVYKCLNPEHLLWQSTVHFPFHYDTLVKLTVVNRIHPQSKKFVKGVKNTRGGVIQVCSNLSYDLKENLNPTGKWSEMKDYQYLTKSLEGLYQKKRTLESKGTGNSLLCINVAERVKLPARKHHRPALSLIQWEMLQVAREGRWVYKLKG